MSAWYVLSALGFYPVTPEAGIYVLGTPTFEKAEIGLPGGRSFVVEAEGLDSEGKNIYIRSAEWNGEPYTKSYITHEMIEQGGTLVLHMGAEPNPDFGAEPADRPVARIPEEDALTSEQMLADIVFEPYIEDTARVFGSSVTLFPKCAAPQPRKIVYTLDGSEPTTVSPIVPIGGITLTGDAEVKLRALAMDGRQDSPVKSYRFYKSALKGAKVTLEREPSAPYVNGGAAALADFAMGGGSYVRPEWVGFQGRDAAGVIDLGTVRSLRHVGFDADNEPRSWIVLPRGAEFEFSTDGVNYGRPVRIETEDGLTAASGAHYFGASIPGGVRARYIRFRIENGLLPAGHIGEGNPAWMFLDEIMAY